MADSGEREFMIAATLDAVKQGQEFSGVPHMLIARWLQEPLDWEKFESRIQFLFDRPDPFVDPDATTDPIVENRSRDDSSRRQFIHELGNVSRWPSLGVETVVINNGGKLPQDERFTPTIASPRAWRLRRGKRVQFSSIAIVESADDSTGRVLFAQPITNTKPHQRQRTPWLPNWAKK